MPNYIVAVSGGVDSVALLDILNKKEDAKLIIAHVDHGIRDDSIEDALFVENLAKKYKLPFESVQLKLGKDASEDASRQERYRFFEELAKKYDAQIATAHHKNDVVETMIINILRGTGWRGLCSLRNEVIYRPLLAMTKKQIVDYAKKNNLQWREDETNAEQIYLRNYIRHNIMPNIDLEDWWKLYQNQLQLRRTINSELELIKSSSRYDFIMCPESVALETLRNRYELTRPQAKKMLYAIKVSRPGSKVELSKFVSIHLKKSDFTLEM
jgi:tRNA(Ile)-lysidine synthase